MPIQIYCICDRSISAKSFGQPVYQSGSKYDCVFDKTSTFEMVNYNQYFYNFYIEMDCYENGGRYSSLHFCFLTVIFSALLLKV